MLKGMRPTMMTIVSQRRNSHQQGRSNQWQLQKQPGDACWPIRFDIFALNCVPSFSKLATGG